MLQVDESFENPDGQFVVKHGHIFNKLNFNSIQKLI